MTDIKSLLLEASFQKLRQALDGGEFSSVELCQAVFENLKNAHQLNTFISSFEEHAIQQAQDIQSPSKSSNLVPHPLKGIPLGLKDLILYKGFKCTAASKMLENFKAPYQSTVARKLLEAGAVVVGKNNLDEFAMGSSNESSYFGPARNPWDLERVPGGSSGGSAAAVAAGIVPISLGTDTGGSIRQPAALCGVTGIKPSYGRVSRYGVVAFASSLDQVGPLGWDAWACAAALEAIAGHDSYDATSSIQKVPAFYSEMQKRLEANDLRGKRIGLPKEFWDEDIDSDVRLACEKAIEFYKAQGLVTVPVSLPHVKYSLSTYYLLCTSECSSNLARYDGIHYGYRSPLDDKPSNQSRNLIEIYERSRAEALGDEVKLRILAGSFALSSGFIEAYYQKAAQVRRLIYDDYKNAFEHCDFIASPTSPTTAFRLGEKTQDPISMYLSDVFTLSTNLAGLPGISFNVGYQKQAARQLPVGFQLMAPWWQELDLLVMAGRYQTEHPQHCKRAPFLLQNTATQKTVESRSV